MNLKLVAKQIQPKVHENTSVYSLVVTVYFEIEQTVRRAILERIYNIFKNIVSFRSFVENTQARLINYFPLQSDRIMDILEKQTTEERNNCGDCACLIF